jgi:rSAM/selenodomain-associated transferase 1
MKYPEAGKVKTRLAAELGAASAAELYHGWIGSVLTRLQPLRGRARVVGFTAGAETQRFAEWDGMVDAWIQQPDGDLGVRLQEGFASGLAMGPTVAIGTDCLDLTAGHVESSIELLHSADAVFGPTRDGGYYLVALKRELPEFFQGIRWSSPDALGDHLAKCEKEAWAVRLIETLEDIDTAEDWSASANAAPPHHERLHVCLRRHSNA